MKDKPRINLPPDPDGQNEDRATWADVAVRAFQNEVNTEDEDVLCDLLCDLRHWADRFGQDWDKQLARAMGHYQDETEELDPDTDAMDRDRNE